MTLNLELLLSEIAPCKDIYITRLMCVPTKQYSLLEYTYFFIFPFTFLVSSFVNRTFRE